MGRIQRLTEKEYAYFERQEKDGKALILRIDIRELIHTDLDELFAGKGGDDNET